MTEARPAPELSDDDYQDQAAFRIALRRFLHFSEQQANSHGITPRQYLLLLITRGHPLYPRVTIRDLAEAMQLRQSSMSLLVDRTVKRGLLHRAEDQDDRRRTLITLTLEGQKILDAILHANRRELGLLEDALFRRSLLEAVNRYNQIERERVAP